MAVRPEYQGGKVGTKLSHWGTDTADKKGLEVRIHLAIFDVCKKDGF